MLSKEAYLKLSKLTKSLFDKNDPQLIGDTITRNICTLLNASASSLVRYDKKKKQVSIISTYHLSENYLRAAKADIATARKTCESKKTKFTKDIKRLYRKGDTIFDLTKKEGVVSLVSVPLTIGKSTIGCVNAYYRRPLKAFKMREDLDLFAKLSALAIQQARMTSVDSEKTKMLEGLEDIGSVPSTAAETKETMKVILSTAVHITGADSASLILVNEQSRVILNAYEYKKGARKVKEYASRARLRDGISDEILTTKKIITVADLRKYDNVNPVAIKKRRVSVAGIPLMARDKVIGILFVDYFTPKKFTNADLDYLMMLGTQTAIVLDNILLNKVVKREAKETALLYEVSQSLISTLDFDQLLNNILQHLKETFDFLNLSVLLVDEEKNMLYTHSSITYSPEDNDLRLRIGKDGITGHVAKTRRIYYSADVSKDNYYVAGIEGTRSEACFPLLVGERLIGVLDVESSEVKGFSQDAIRLLASLSAQIAIAMDNARLYEETKRLSLTDPLTLLSNRRSFHIVIDAEIKRAERYRRTFVVMMIDFDNFKNYNDKFGHSAGDIILQKLSKIMKEIIRDVDFLCRYGGDEFVAILPETDASFALDVAERMRKRIAAQKISPKITLSIGIASFPHDARDKSKLIDLADQACFEAKQRGGNRVLFTFKTKEQK
ncbi:diguanylate cyclase [candidate division WOR-3 bacterium]|nr:diguanylate cyclase [candidate division WOR-3 bacterium]